MWPCLPGNVPLTPSCKHMMREMSMQLCDSKHEDGVVVDCVTAVGVGMFGHPVWPWAYNNFVHAADHEA